MRVYLAAKFGHREEMIKEHEVLTKSGIEVTSRWYFDHVPANDDVATIAERRRYAEEDLADIERCDALVFHTEKPATPGRGGRHVELGYALGLGKQVYLVGDYFENVFHWLPRIHHIPLVVSYQDLANRLLECNYALFSGRKVKHD